MITILIISNVDLSAMNGVQKCGRLFASLSYKCITLYNAFLTIIIIIIIIIIIKYSINFIIIVIIVIQLKQSARAAELV